MIRSSILALALLAPWVASAATIPHAGRLLDASDAPVTGTVSLRFRLHSAGIGGTALWESNACPVSVRGGSYSVSVGGDCAGSAPLTDALLDPTQPRFLEVSVEGVDLAPRFSLNSVPSAVQSRDAQALIARLAATGTLNAASNPVSWTQLKDVPAGFADGTDGSIEYQAGAGLSLTGTQFAISPGGVQSPMLADGAVTLSKLSTEVTGALTPADGSVSATKLAANAVDSSKLALDSSSLSRVSGGMATVSGGELVVTGQLRQRYTAGGPSTVIRTDASGNLGIDTSGGRAVSINYDPASRGGAGLFEVYTGSMGSPRLVVDTLGNVGIGTASPQARLDVSGGIRADAISVGSNPVLTAADINAYVDKRLCEYRNGTWQNGACTEPIKLTTASYSAGQIDWNYDGGTCGAGYHVCMGSEYFEYVAIIRRMGCPAGHGFNGGWPQSETEDRNQMFHGHSNTGVGQYTAGPMKPSGGTLIGTQASNGTGCALSPAGDTRPVWCCVNRTKNF